MAGLKDKKRALSLLLVVLALVVAVVALNTGNFGTYQEGNSMTPECLYALLLFGILFYCFATSLFPGGVTAMLGAFAVAGAGLISYKTLFESFAGQAVLVVLGMMVIGAAFREVGLSDDLGRWIVRRFSSHPKAFLLVLVATSGLLSAVMSNTSVTVILMSVASAAAVAADGKIQRKFSYMAIAMAAVVGGNMTLFGSTPQLSVADAITQDWAGQVRALTNWDLFKTTMPAVALMVLFYWLIGDRLQKKVFSFEEVPEEGTKHETETKPLSKKITLLVIFALCVVLFAIGSYEWQLADGSTFTLGISSGTAAVMGAVACILFGCITEKKALSSISWSSLTLLGGVIAFSSGVKVSGAVGFLSSILPDGFFAYVILVLVAILMTNLMSNTAVAIMLVPIGIQTALRIGYDPMGFVTGILLAANLSFATPMATPPVTITRTVGYRFGDYVKVGGAFTLVAAVYVLTCIPLMYGFFA